MPLFRPRIRRPSSDNIEPCLPRLAKAPPTGPDWIHEIKHDGFRILPRRDGPKVRLISRHGRDLTYRFPDNIRANDGAAPRIRLTITLRTGCRVLPAESRGIRESCT